MKAVLGHPLVNLLVSLVVLMALFAGAKLAVAGLPDAGIVGDFKKLILTA